MKDDSGFTADESLAKNTASSNVILTLGLDLFEKGKVTRSLTSNYFEVDAEDGRYSVTIGTSKSKCSCRAAYTCQHVVAAEVFAAKRDAVKENIKPGNVMILNKRKRLEEGEGRSGRKKPRKRDFRSDRDSSNTESCNDATCRDLEMENSEQGIQPTKIN